MADILIRGMEMPESCGECPFYRLEGVGNDMCWDYCAGKRGIVYDPDNERESDCPLIALPEGHGRLVDADAYCAEMKKRQDACAEWRDDAREHMDEMPFQYIQADAALGVFCEAKLTLNKIPTIVPAEKEDTQ